MNLIHYIQGIRKGQEINRLEREAMDDPFLAEAMEGYDKIRGNHEIRIRRIQGKISARPAPSKRSLPPSNHTLHQWSIAATLFLLLSIGGGYLWWTMSLRQPEAEKKAAITDTAAAPQPVIGIKAYNDYLKANLVRPADEECKNVTGVVTLSFSVDEAGHPYDIQIIKSLCPLSDREAMRLLKEGPVWTTSELNATVNVYF